MTLSFRGGGRGKNEMLSDVGIWEMGGGVGSECSGHPIVIFFIKKN